MAEEEKKEKKVRKKRKKEEKEKKEKKESPAKIARKRFKEVEKKEPRRAAKIKARISGEIYGLYPTVFGYASDIVVDAIFKEGIYQYGLD